MTQPAEKRVTWAELFFDLVFVFAVTQVAALLHDDHGWGGVGRALDRVRAGLVGLGRHLDPREHARRRQPAGPHRHLRRRARQPVHGARPHRPVRRARGPLRRQLLGAAAGPRGAGVPRAADARVNAFSVGLFVTGPLLLLGGLLDGGWRIGIWAVAALIDLSVPALVTPARSPSSTSTRRTCPSASGCSSSSRSASRSSSVGVAARGDPLTAARLAAVAAAFVLACGLWWVYFALRRQRGAPRRGDREGADRHHPAGARVRAPAVHRRDRRGRGRPGRGRRTTRPKHLHFDVAALLIGGTALYLALFGYTRWRMFGTLATTRLIAAARDACCCSRSFRSARRW